MLNQIPTDFGIPAESQFQGFGITRLCTKDPAFQVAEQIVVFQQDAVLERLMPMLDFALG
jgi:hypothetical protein